MLDEERDVPIYDTNSYPCLIHSFTLTSPLLLRIHNKINIFANLLRIHNKITIFAHKFFVTICIFVDNYQNTQT